MKSLRQVWAAAQRNLIAEGGNRSLGATAEGVRNPDAPLHFNPFTEYLIL